MGGDSCENGVVICITWEVTAVRMEESLVFVGCDCYKNSLYFSPKLDYIICNSNIFET